MRAALVTAARHEQLLHFHHYRERVVSGRIVRNLVANAYHLEDRAKSEGGDGYELASRRALAFPLHFRLSMEVQRRLGWQIWLARCLGRSTGILAGRPGHHAQLAALCGESHSGNARGPGGRIP